eukprot:1427178-Rhodomonas_salina.1
MAVWITWECMAHVLSSAASAPMPPALCTCPRTSRRQDARRRGRGGGREGWRPCRGWGGGSSRGWRARRRRGAGSAASPSPPPPPSPPRPTAAQPRQPSARAGAWRGEAGERTWETWESLWSSRRAVRMAAAALCCACGVPWLRHKHIADTPDTRPDGVA